MTKVNWKITVNGLPPKDHKSAYYGDRYSIPVLLKGYKSYVYLIAYRWDYDYRGWVAANLQDDPDSWDYDQPDAKQWAEWPT